MHDKNKKGPHGAGTPCGPDTKTHCNANFIAPPAPVQEHAVEIGGRILGFLVPDRHGWQALTGAARIVGCFPTQHRAASALIAVSAAEAVANA